MVEPTSIGINSLGLAVLSNSAELEGDGNSLKTQG